MSTPPVGASWSTVRHRGTWTDLDMLTRLPGQWSLSVPVDITNSADDVIIPAFTKRGNLSTANGQPSLDLLIPVVDDPDNLPSGTFYFTLKVSVQGTPERTFYLQPTMAQADAGTVINLRLLVPNLSPPPVEPSRFFGGPGGVPGPLDANGLMPADQLPTGSGGGGGGLDLEAVQDAVAQMVLAGSNITKTYNDAAGTLTLAATGLDTEAVQDVVGAMVVGGTNVTVQYNDTAGTLTVNAAGGSGGSGLDLEQVQDAVAAMITPAGILSKSYDDTNGVLTLTATAPAGWDAEQTRDTIGAALVGSGNITVTVNDAADTITISTTATQNSTDAQLRDRSTHTGTQSMDTTTDSTANNGRLAMTSAERSKLAAVAAGATANATDAQLRDRSTHTGTQPVSTVTGAVGSSDGSVVDKVRLTQAAYDALATKVATTEYTIVG